MPEEEQPARPPDEGSASDLLPREPPPGAPEADVPLDASLMKVLASDTRLDLLRLLKQRRMTLSEMARALGLQKATVLEHLGRLTGSGLVRRRDDERLWVYYELTRRGANLLHPGRARIYLLVGSSLAAIIVGVALTVALLPSPPEQPPPFLATLLDEAEVAAESPFALRALVAGAEGNVSAWLLVPESAEALAENQSGAAGIPLLAEGLPPVVTVRVPQPVAPGNYALYIRDSAGRDNRDAMPRVGVEALQVALSHATWWRGLDGPLEVTLTRGATGLDGVLLLSRAGGGTQELAGEVRNGSARLAPEHLDRAGPGMHLLRFHPAGGEPLDLPARLDLREPGIAVAPLAIPEGRPAELRVAVHAAGAPPPPVRLGDTELPAGAARPGAPGYSVPARAPGVLQLEVGRLARFELLVLPDPAWTIAALGDGALELRLASPGSEPIVGAPVLLDGQPLGFTNASGALRFPAPPSGAHRLTLLHPSGEAVHRGVVTRGWNVTEAGVGLLIEPAEAPAPPGTAVVQVNATAASPAVVTVVASLSGQIAAAQAMELDPAKPASASLQLFGAAPGNHTVLLEAEPMERTPLRFLNLTPPPTPPPAPPPGGGGVPSPTAPPTMPPSAPGTVTSLPEIGRAFALLSVSIMAREPTMSSSEPPTASAEAIPAPAPPPSPRAPTPGFGVLLALAAVATAILARPRRS